MLDKKTANIIREVSLSLLGMALSDLLFRNQLDVKYYAIGRELASDLLYIDPIIDSGIDIETEIRQTDLLVMEIIASINTNFKKVAVFSEKPPDFFKVWEIDKWIALSEIYRATRQTRQGLTCLSWWINDCQKLGFKDIPQVDFFELPYNEAQIVLDRFVAYVQYNLAYNTNR
jgi:hypothetical protein